MHESGNYTLSFKNLTTNQTKSIKLSGARNRSVPLINILPAKYEVFVSPHSSSKLKTNKEPVLFSIVSDTTRSAFPKLVDTTYKPRVNIEGSVDGLIVAKDHTVTSFLLTASHTNPDRNYVFKLHKRAQDFADIEKDRLIINTNHIETLEKYFYLYLLEQDPVTKKYSIATKKTIHPDKIRSKKLQRQLPMPSLEIDLKKISP